MRFDLIWSFITIKHCDLTDMVVKINCESRKRSWKKNVFNKVETKFSFCELCAMNHPQNFEQNTFLWFFMLKRKWLTEELTVSEILWKLQILYGYLVTFVQQQLLDITSAYPSYSEVSNKRACSLNYFTNFFHPARPY